MFETTPFYHATVRKYVAAFGTLFNNISIRRWDGLGNAGNVQKTIKVPLAYGSREKWLRRIEEESSISTREKVKVTTPRMSFQLVDFVYDSTRQTTRIDKLQTTINTNRKDFQYQRVPYNFVFEVNVLVDYLNDGLQIVEQILPYFSPAFILSINDNDDIGNITDCPIVLDSVTNEDMWEGSFEESRIMTWTLGFTMRGWIYNPTKSSNVIKKVIVDFHSDTDGNAPRESRVTIVPDPDTAGPNDTYTINTTIDFFDDAKEYDPNTGDDDTDRSSSSSSSSSQSSVSNSSSSSSSSLSLSTSSSSSSSNT